MHRSGSGCGRRTPAERRRGQEAGGALEEWWSCSQGERCSRRGGAGRGEESTTQGRTTTGGDAARRCPSARFRTTWQKWWSWWSGQSSDASDSRWTTCPRSSASCAISQADATAGSPNCRSSRDSPSPRDHPKRCRELRMRCLCREAVPRSMSRRTMKFQRRPGGRSSGPLRGGASCRTMRVRVGGLVI